MSDYDKIKEQLKESSEPHQRAMLLLELASEAWKKGSYNEGKTFAEAALELGMNLADEGVQARASHLIGTFYAYLDDYDAALEYYLRAQVLNHKMGNSIWEAECYNSMGDIFIRLANISKATDCFEQALLLRPDYERSINNLGYVRMLKGELDEAISFYRKAITIAEAASNLRSVIISHINISDIFCKKGMAEAALEELEQAQGLLEKATIETPLELTCALKLNLAAANIALEKTDIAKGLLLEARDLATNAKLQDYLLKSQAMLADLYAEAADWEAAYKSQWEYSKLYRQIMNNQTIQKANSIQSFYARENRTLISMNLTERSSRLATLGILSSGITHELNQPLSAIRISTESILYWLKREEITLPMNFNQELSHIMEGIKRIESFLRQIRQFWNSGKAARVESCRLEEIIDQSLSMLSRRIFAGGVVLNQEPSSLELPQLRVAPIHLQQIIINLLAYCLDILEGSSHKQKILILETSSQDDSICLSLAQNGSEITRDMMNQLYNPLSPEAQNAPSEMGMAIVKYLCDHYQYRLSCFEEDGFWGFRLWMEATK